MICIASSMKTSSSLPIPKSGVSIAGRTVRPQRLIPFAAARNPVGNLFSPDNESNHEILHNKAAAPLFVAATSLCIAIEVLFSPLSAIAGELAASNASDVFARSCQGCHAGGKNVVQGDKTLFRDDLEKYGMNSVDAVYNITYNGKGKMPGFGEGCAPKGSCTFAARLSDETIRDLSEYVIKQAEAGWK